ncbi:SPFH domain-containing protein [Amnibacterium setariae]|uniref:Flotillin family protein n=1 Tax=Amnibacterium setariae TaxID=2306585 RepID=A0A3A1U121_9MICO|nr:flotillin family protein [Amnibacterium setariae]RIX28146.1 flotillin family protein [Amnibacterium setariae]
MIPGFGTALVVVAVVVVVLLILLITLLRGIKVAKPDEAIIVTSRQRGARTGSEEDENAGQRVVFGSRVFVKPIVEAYFKLSLRSRQLNVQATAQTRDAITIRVNAVAVVKVGGSEQMVRAAAQRFLNQQDQIESSTEEVLSGSVRSIVGQLTVTEIITNRQALQGQVLEAVRESLDVQGLQIDTLQIKEIDDDNGYIRDLGRAEAARVKQVAEIAESVARQASEEARIGADQAVAEQQRKLDLRRAEIRKETDRAGAEAAAAAPLAEAIAQQEVVAQQELTAGKRVGLRKQELEAEVRAVADADAYAVSTRAQAEAKAERDRRIAAAEAVRAEGEAEAERIRATGAAQAESSRAQAEALQERAAALLQQQLIEQLPAIVRAAAEPLSGIGAMTIIASDGDPTGPLGQSVAGQLATSTKLIKDLVGIDIAEIVNGRAAGAAAGEAAGAQLAKRRSPAAETDGVGL